MGRAGLSTGLRAERIRAVRLHVSPDRRTCLNCNTDFTNIVETYLARLSCSGEAMGIFKSHLLMSYILYTHRDSAPATSPSTQDTR